jgi:hypothetical protein
LSLQRTIGNKAVTKLLTQRQLIGNKSNVSKAEPPSASTLEHRDIAETTLTPSATFITAIQRKMGFEFETENTVEKWNGEEWKPVGRQKNKPLYKGTGFNLETDTHYNCEFILKPQDSLNDVQQAAQEAATLCNTVNTGATATETAEQSNLPVKIGEFENGKWQGKYRIKVKDTEWKADAQITQGISLEHIPNYLEDTLSTDEHKDLQTMLSEVDISNVSPKVHSPPYRK